MGEKSERYAQQNNIYLFYIMQKVIQKSLRTTIIQQISRLNSSNAEFYATLRKLNAIQQRMNQTFNQKLQGMKVEIKNKIRQLSANIDLMYQMMDRKILILIHKIQQNSGDPSVLEQQLHGARNKAAILQQELTENKNKYNALLTQNQYLKTKNIALIEQIQILNRKKNNTITNDSSRNINPKTDIAEDPQNSQGNYLSPLQQPGRANLYSNDLTFNKNTNTITNLNNINKKIKSEENSFSSLLLKEQNSFDPSYGSEKQENKKFSFGCMPVKSQEMKFQFGNNNLLKMSECGKDEGHRMSFLINNLRDSNNQSFASEQNSRFQYSGQEKSVLSRGAVKKYHI